jgi:hypothetical protein
MTIHTHTPASSCIAELMYDDETEICEVTFQDGRHYVIRNFPEAEYLAWSESDSAGSFFNANVRGVY